MGYVFLVLAFIAIIALEWVLDNILWIGCIWILLLIISIFRAFPDYREFGFDFNDFMLLVLKLAGITGMIVLMMCV